MSLPVGLDLKTIVVTVLFMVFVLPFVMNLVASKRSGTSQAA